jgi:hypothetical protein
MAGTVIPEDGWIIKNSQDRLKGPDGEAVPFSCQ